MDMKNYKFSLVSNSSIYTTNPDAICEALKTASSSNADSHVGIPGNKTANKIANEASLHKKCLKIKRNPQKTQVHSIQRTSTGLLIFLQINFES